MNEKHMEEVKANGTKMEEKIHKSGKKIFIILAILILILIVAGVYVGVAMRYRTCFLPNTSINNLNCSELDAAQVAGLLENQIQDYSLTVVGRDYITGESGAVLGTITASDIDLTYGDENLRMSVEELIAAQNVFLWPYSYFGNYHFGHSLLTGVSYNKELLAELVKGWEACQTGNMTVSEDAYISEYSETLNGYEIIPEKIGTAFDIELLLEQIDAALSIYAASAVGGATPEAGDVELNLDDSGCYEDAAVTSRDAKLVKAVEEANRMLKTQITYDWNGEEVILDKILLRDWVSIENNEAILNEEAVKAFVKENSEIHDTYGKPRKFMTYLGVELTLPSGYYGWQTDKAAETEELLKLIYAGSVEKREPIYSSTAKKKGMSDIGSSYVEADLTHQHLYLYQDGQLVLETDFVSGSMSSTPDCVTPQGVFGISYKTSPAVLRGADYVTPVTYWMPFYGNYGMHDATWRTEFGGDIYIANGSHGCLNLPLDAAGTIYQYMSAGFPVICYYYPVDPLAAQPEAEPETSEESEEDEE